jgi:hypothetical protein
VALAVQVALLIWQAILTSNARTPFSWVGLGICIGLTFFEAITTFHEITSEEEQ